MQNFLAQAIISPQRGEEQAEQKACSMLVLVLTSSCCSTAHARISPPLVSTPIAWLMRPMPVMTTDRSRKSLPVMTADREEDAPQPGGLVDTVRRLRADYTDGAAATRDYFRQPAPAEGSPLTDGTTAVQLCVAAAITVLQVEVVQFVTVFAAAWLCGLGVPVGVPSRGMRLTIAAQTALSSRHGARVARLLFEAARFPLVLRALRRAPDRREHVQDALARPLAVLAVAVLTARAFDRSLLARSSGSPASALCGTIGLAGAASALVEKASECGLAVTHVLARTEAAARELPLLRLALDATEADDRVAELLAAVWCGAIRPVLLWSWKLLVALRRLLFR